MEDRTRVPRWLRRWRDRDAGQSSGEQLYSVVKQPMDKPVNSDTDQTLSPRRSYSTDLGEMWEGDSLDYMRALDADSVDLILTSPPFALVREKEYGNKAEDEYVDWFLTFAHEFKRVIHDHGSIVIDLGGAWQPGRPTKSIYQFKLLVALVEEVGLFLAQDFYWFNRSKMPGPAQWVTVERQRVKDAVNTIWWLSKSERPRADNRNVLRPYKADMKRMLKTGEYNRGERIVGHKVGENWATDRGGAIAPNVFELDGEPLWTRDAVGGLPLTGAAEPDNMLDYPNTVSRHPYHTFCKVNDLARHPARFPRKIPEFFVNFLTEEGDLVLDPFGGSNVTGEVAEDLKRRWVAVEQVPEYIVGSLGRFSRDALTLHDPWLNDMLAEDLGDLLDVDAEDRSAGPYS